MFNLPSTRLGHEGELLHRATFHQSSGTLRVPSDPDSKIWSGLKPFSHNQGRIFAFNLVEKKGIRTFDIRSLNSALYQLSYIPDFTLL